MGGSSYKAINRAPKEDTVVLDIKKIGAADRNATVTTSMLIKQQSKEGRNVRDGKMHS